MYIWLAGAGFLSFFVHMAHGHCLWVGNAFDPLGLSLCRSLGQKIELMVGSGNEICFEEEGNSKLYLEDEVLWQESCPQFNVLS